MLEPRTLVKFLLCLANCAGTPHNSGVCDVVVRFLHISIDFLNSITSDFPCWKFRTLSSCCIGTPRLSLHWNTTYRFYLLVFTFVYEFLFSVSMSEYNNFCFPLIHHINFKNIYITINKINTRYVREC